MIIRSPARRPPMAAAGTWPVGRHFPVRSPALVPSRSPSSVRRVPQSCRGTWGGCLRVMQVPAHSITARRLFARKLRSWRWSSLKRGLYVGQRGLIIHIPPYNLCRIPAASTPCSCSSHKNVYSSIYATQICASVYTALFLAVFF
jgi:hypothetical protein